MGGRISVTLRINPIIGLEKLFNASISGASHDSSERYPPTCHPGTLQDYIQRLTQLGLNRNDRTDQITWLKGPAGVGKSAIAQSCADALLSRKKASSSLDPITETTQTIFSPHLPIKLL